MRRVVPEKCTVQSPCHSDNLGGGHPFVFKAQYCNNIQYVLRLTQLCAYFIIILLLTNSFGLKSSSSGQYLQKLKNAGAVIFRVGTCAMYIMVTLH
jgi:hypothetical protein